MIDISGSEFFKFEISYLIGNFVMLLSLSEFRTVFEFFIYAGRDTHRFRRQYYKKSFWKRELMLTVFDETLVNESKYKKQMETIFWSNVGFKALTLILVILRCIFTFKGSIPILFAVINLSVFAAWLIFVFWVHAHRIDDWRGWIKPITYSRDFSMRLPDEKAKKKTKKKKYKLKRFNNKGVYYNGKIGLGILYFNVCDYCYFFLDNSCCCKRNVRVFLFLR